MILVVAPAARAQEPTERERIESLSDNDLIREIGFCDTDGGEILGEKLAAQVVRRRTVYGRKL